MSQHHFADQPTTRNWKNAMKRTWTIIGVSDVPRSFKWYQSLFGQRKTPPAHDDFGQILDTDGTVLLCLHQWGAHGHPSLMSPDEASPGNGLLLFFRVDDFGPALKRARTLVTRFEEEPHVNPNTQTREFSLRDPDRYCVTISALPAPQRLTAFAPQFLVDDLERSIGYYKSSASRSARRGTASTRSAVWTDWNCI